MSDPTILLDEDPQSTQEGSAPPAAEPAQQPDELDRRFQVAHLRQQASFLVGALAQAAQHQAMVERHLAPTADGVTSQRLRELGESLEHLWRLAVAVESRVRE